MVEGRRTYDVLMGLARTDAGQVPVPDVHDQPGLVAHEYFTKYPGRFFSMHLQDII